MGLFSKLKDNMTHGGVKVHVQAPSSVPGNQVIPITVSISADSSQTINSIKAEIKAQAREQGVSLGGGGIGGVGVQESRTTAQTVAQVESREPFTIGPGETKTVNLELFISGNAGTANKMGQIGNMNEGMGGAFQALASVAQNFAHVNYIYSVHASVDVQGVSLDPSDKQPIQILPSAEGAQTVQPAQPATNTQSQAQPQITLPVPPTPAMPSPIPPPQSDESNSNQTQ